MPPTKKDVHLYKVESFIRLRWFAAGGGLAVLLIGPALLPVEIKNTPLLIFFFALLALFNGGYLAYWKKIRSTRRTPERLLKNAMGLLRVQMVVDLLALTAVLYLSGGTGNPLFLFYLFHMVLSRILFSDFESLFYAGLVLALPWVLYFVEPAGSGARFLWAGGQEPPAAHELVILLAYSMTVGGLWLFLSSLTLDLEEKEKRLKETGVQIFTANEGLKQQDAYKTRFLRQVVNQLKGPAMDMGLDLAVVERTLSPENNEALKAVDGAKKRVWSLLQLIEDLTWLCRVKVQEIRFNQEWIDVGAVLTDCVGAMEERTTARGIRIQLAGERGIRLRADKVALARVMENLMESALRSTPDGGADVRVEYREEDGWVICSVEDRGVGLSAKDQKRLTRDDFHEPIGKAQDKIGTGLGLSIVKYILDLHDGKVKVRSRAQQGALVETWWPQVLSADTVEKVLSPEEQVPS